jgi:hypothetical protein
MFRKFIVVAALAALALGITTAAVAANPPGKIVKVSRASGQFAVTSTSAKVQHPHALYGRATGHVDSASFIVSCSRGFTISSNSLDRDRAGTWRLPMMGNPDSCTVIAAVGGSGKISVEIRVV